MKLTNDWNRLVYRLWAPVYDSTVNRLFTPGRKRALELLGLRRGERVLLVGVGTGEDLPLLPAGVEAVGIDISPEMLRRAKGKLQRCQAQVKLVEGDAQAPIAEAVTFDAAILNLILSVAPDGNACFQSTMRAVKPGGRAVIFDKFLPDGRQASRVRRLTNAFSTLLGTDINRHLNDVVTGVSCQVLCNEPSIGGGLYRIVLLRKPECENAGI